MAHGPVDDAALGGLWTGQALVRIAEGQIGGAIEQINPGDAAAWDPATDTWISLMKSPIMTSEDQVVWTGDEILSYGPTTSVRFARRTQP